MSKKKSESGNWTNAAAVAGAAVGSAAIAAALLYVSRRKDRNPRKPIGIPPETD